MIIKIETSSEYTPEWNGNRTDDTPIVIQHLTPTMALHDALVPKPSMAYKFDAEGNTLGGEVDVVVDNKKTIQKMVTGIKNLTLEIDGKKLAITNGADLFGPSVPSFLTGLTDEIGKHLQSILTKKEFDAKN